MIRTNSVTLTTLPSAIAYRRKGTSGGSALVIVRADSTQPGIATISKTSGKPIVQNNTPDDLFPIEAFEEAATLTAGMPYRKRGKPAAPKATEPAVPEPTAEEPEETEIEQAAAVLIDTNEYQQLLETYTNKDGKFSYDLMNKEMIQFAHKSEMVKYMVAAGDSESEIIAYIVGTRFRNATGNKELSDHEVTALIGLVEEVSPKGAFKELKRSIRSLLGKAKSM